MLMQADFDLNSVQRHTDSLKEVLRQTMFQQEVMFQKQVHELHRLYQVQKSLKNDPDYNEYDGYNSWNAKPHSSLPPLPNHTRCEPLVKETRFFSIAEVASTLQGYQVAYHRLQQKPLDLQLSADEFINHVEADLLEKGDGSNHLKHTTDNMYPLSGRVSSGPDELRLSLGSRVENRKTGGTLRSLFDKKSQHSCQNVIDLEEPDERLSNEYKTWKPSPGCVAPEIYSYSNPKSQVSLFSNLVTSPTSVNKGAHPKIAQSSSCQEYTESHLLQSSSNKGIIERHDGILCSNLSTKIQHFDLNHGWDLDLNKIHFDDSFCSIIGKQAYPSTTNSPSDFCGATSSIQEGTCPAMLWKNEANKSSIEASDSTQQDISGDPALADSNDKNMSPDSWAISPKSPKASGNVVDLICSESKSKPPVVSFEEHGSCTGDQSNDNVKLKSENENCILHDSDSTSVASKEGSCGKSVVEDAGFSYSYQSQQTYEDRNDNNSPASCKSCVCNDDSSSVKKIPLGNVARALNVYLETHLGSQEINGLQEEHDLRASNSTSLKKEGYSKKEKSAGEDDLIQSAAESLIFLNNPISCQGSLMNESAKELEKGKREQPQYSFDSFELIAMNLTQSNMEDDSVSSKPFELDDGGAKDFGLKLRRGRRMKDFQKEILPGLASLSRQEIREDINIMEGVLRSREYRKMRAQMENNVDNWSTLVRSKRSRLNYTGRKNFSWKCS